MPSATAVDPCGENSVCSDVIIEVFWAFQLHAHKETALSYRQSGFFI